LGDGSVYSDSYLSIGSSLFSVPKSQSITFAALSTKYYGDASSTLSATGGGSGNPVFFTSSDSNVATCTGTDGTVLNIIGVGTCTIYANQAAGGIYAAAPQISRTLVVDKGTPAVTVIVGTYTYNGSHQGPNSATNTGTGTSYTYSYAGTGSTNYAPSATAPTAGGTYTITATVAANDYYNSASSEVTAFTILSSGTIASNTNISNITLSSTSDISITGTGYLVVDATKTVSSLTIDAGGKINFTGTNQFSIIGDLILKSTENKTENTSFSANIGSGTLDVTGDIKYLKTIDDKKWYFISFPSDVQISTISGSPALGTLGTNWFIKYYDGAKRGLTGTGSNWVSIMATDLATYPKLNKYQGYIIGLATGKLETEITFTLDKTVLSTETTRNIPVAVNNAGAISPTNHGWNLIGQPYLSKYLASNNATGADSYYIYISDGTSTYTGYPSATAPNMNPMSAYFVQASSLLATG
jgi:hypothetical protein